MRTLVLSGVAEIERPLRAPLPTDAESAVSELSAKEGAKAARDEPTSAPGIGC